jgi:hypothetical protein
MAKQCSKGAHALDSRTAAAGGEVCFDCATKGTDYTSEQVFKYGDRVELHPACDLWMRGATHGQVRGERGGYIVVKMDHPEVKKLQYLNVDLLRHVR